ncbi:cytochrome c-type biogenesis protein [Fretibacter rubidus]|uniref:cytochrome c-type biogenesis protein n=1 Tax=Fretibacter rubidus TaxID=570162 RepID=UPI00352B2F64
MFALTVLAQGPNEAELEARAKDVGHMLRCVVCQNQSIEESDASLAEDMRRLVRSRLKNGDTDAEVIDFMRERYGDYVLLKPPVQRNTYILWFAPFGIALLGGVWFVVSARRKHTAETVAPLSEDERQILDGILHSKE